MAKRPQSPTPATHPQRPGKKHGVRSEFTIVSQVIPGHEQAIRDTIIATTKEPRRFEETLKLGTLHELRHVLFDHDTRHLFITSFDGDWDQYIEDFGGSWIGTEVFDKILSHLVGYPGITNPRVKDWFMTYAQEAVTFGTSYPDATVKEILKALALQKAFQEVLDNPAAEAALQDPALMPLLDFAAQ